MLMINQQNLRYALSYGQLPYVHRFRALYIVYHVHCTVYMYMY